ncbi:hypothetical protein BDN70DRAFT_883244 [Pholiota conissans]|uniref:Nephrocystin 3-like N-terminal domain-containing protein n=1 Tax=Pholiota conissans TaxID=109636 RepID=A0A9P5YUQ9_9AGAR|nr:hypothetical protein BDN70DRAFT_883244 [Pholiota conissans]
MPRNTKKRRRNSRSLDKSAKLKLNLGLEAETPTRSESESASGPAHSITCDTRTTRDSIDAASSLQRPTDENARYMIGNNALIMGGQFTMLNSPRPPNVERVGFKLLLQNVAPSAFHNSAQRADPPRCHPKTRVEILEKIYTWIIQSAYRESWLLWLNGAGGAGKTAIMQTMAERCILEALAIASFFFARTDSGRNTMEHLVGSLAYQLMRAIPDTQDDILCAIEEDPLIFAQSFPSQLQRLIVDPLDNLPCRLQQPFAVFIDGLDECLDCAHQSNLIKVLGDISCSRTIPLPVIFLVSSRREPQIKLGFNTIEVSQLLENIPLDDIEASDDIRRLLNINFADIKKTHPFRHLLAPNWPSVSTVSKIVEKASNQFIYASVVINYISSPRANPAQRLKIANDPILQNSSSERPFAHLDLLYRHIFSQVQNYELVSEILTYLSFGFVPIVSVIETIFSLTPGDLEVLLIDLSPILKFQLTPDHCTEVCFLHASLPDFLHDPKRSGEYFLDINKICPKLLHRLHNNFYLACFRH